MFRQKEEFIRQDPKTYSKYYVLRAFSWLVPILTVCTGFFITTQKFAAMMNYDIRVTGEPFFVTSGGFRLYNPGILLLGVFKYAFNKENAAKENEIQKSAKNDESKKNALRYHTENILQLNRSIGQYQDNFFGKESQVVLKKLHGNQFLKRTV